MHHLSTVLAAARPSKNLLVENEVPEVAWREEATQWLTPARALVPGCRGLYEQRQRRTISSADDGIYIFNGCMQTARQRWAVQWAKHDVEQVTASPSECRWACSLFLFKSPSLSWLASLSTWEGSFVPGCTTADPSCCCLVTRLLGYVMCCFAHIALCCWQDFHLAIYPVRTGLIAAIVRLRQY